MDETTKSEINDLVQIKTTELFREDAAKHREFLERISKFVVWAIGLLVLVITTYGYFFIGKRIDATALALVTEKGVKERLDSNVNERIKDAEKALELKISNFKKEIDNSLKSNIDEKIKDKSPEINKKISTIISASISDQIKREIIEKDIQKKIEHLNNFSVNEILKTEVLKNYLPIGTIIASMLSPEQFYIEYGQDKWRLADGSRIEEAAYIKIAKSNKLPDLRGMFLRGINNGRDDDFADPIGDRKPGSTQKDAVGSHSHKMTLSAAIAHPNGGTFARGGAPPYIGIESQTDKFGSNENRPKNAAVFYYIKIN